MKIIFGLSRPKNSFNFFSKAIMAIEKRSFSHAFVVFSEPITNIPLVFQASHGMVHLCKRESFDTKNKSVKLFEMDITPEQFLLLWGYVIEKSGVPYSFAQILFILFNKIFKTKFGFFKNGEKAMICSELCDRVLNIFELTRQEEDEVTPSDFDQRMMGILKNNPNKVRIIEEI